jgi:hypothetical protein
MNWILLTQGRNQWRDHVNIVIDVRGPLMRLRSFFDKVREDRLCSLQLVMIVLLN